MKISPIESSFQIDSFKNASDSGVSVVVVENFPKLGLLTALTFLNWVLENPEGVISLPTGKTPEYFIKWTAHILQNWGSADVTRMLEQHQFPLNRKPDLSRLHFVQIDEFYPISSKQHNSFYDYVRNFYIRGMGLNPDLSLLINSDQIALPGGAHFTEVFPDLKVDLGLRTRECRSSEERLQQLAIFAIDDWCTQYEQQIRELGGIGFFLGGIGPDGHIAFNVRGSDFNSTTRLTKTNFETQAAAASYLGGIEVSRHRLVITIGLSTISANPNVTAVIIAAGEAKADIIRQSLECHPSNLYPASILHSLPNSRFYLTSGAASKLTHSVRTRFETGIWTHEKSQRAVINLCRKLNRFGSRITESDLNADETTALIPDNKQEVVEDVIRTIKDKLQRGVAQPESETILHTGPHHDDIMLGYLPHIMNLIKTPLHQHYFSVLTSGFTSVTNQFLRDTLEHTNELLNRGHIEMVNYPDFFESGYLKKWDKDIYHFLMRVAGGNEAGQQRGLSHRIVRAITDIYHVKDVAQLQETIHDILAVLIWSYNGEKNPPEIQKLKGMIREFEEELVWAHFGVQVKNVFHERLGFYTGDIFTEQPDRTRDVKPILNLLKKIQPTVITLALDPEGSGPDTHYKVLQAIAEAMRWWGDTQDLSHIRIWGYRNVWYRFHPSEADIIVPVSLNEMAALRQSFMTCYLSQKSASFPSYELDGPFCDLSQNIWVKQLHDIQLLLGKDTFYQNPHPRLRSAHGLVYLKELTVDQFLEQARSLEKSMEGPAG